MDQAGLTRKDLAAYIGGKSKVSEMLPARETCLSPQYVHFIGISGFPLKVLDQEAEEPLLLRSKVLDFRGFPIKEMQEQGAFNNFPGNIIKGKADEAIQWLIDESGGFEAPLVAGLDHCRYARKG